MSIKRALNLQMELQSTKDALFKLQADREARTGREQRLIAELRYMKEQVQLAISAANGRWEEWGDRALQVKEMLEKALRYEKS